MQLLWIVLFKGILLSGPSWETDFAKAKQVAHESNKLILLNFSGSDWCGPCIRMEKEIFEAANFNEYASSHLVLLNADFPRLKKHQLSKEQQEKNEELAERFNKKGIFPLTLLITEDGKILKEWEGLPTGSSAVFVNEIRSIIQ